MAVILMLIAAYVLRITSILLVLFCFPLAKWATVQIFDSAARWTSFVLYLSAAARSVWTYLQIGTGVSVMALLLFVTAATDLIVSAVEPTVSFLFEAISRFSVRLVLSHVVAMASIAGPLARIEVEQVCVEQTPFITGSLGIVDALAEHWTGLPVYRSRQLPCVNQRIPHLKWTWEHPMCSKKPVSTFAVPTVLLLMAGFALSGATIFFLSVARANNKVIDIDAATSTLLIEPSCNINTDTDTEVSFTHVVKTDNGTSIDSLASGPVANTELHHAGDEVTAIPSLSTNSAALAFSATLDVSAHESILSAAACTSTSLALTCSDASDASANSCLTTKEIACENSSFAESDSGEAFQKYDEAKAQAALQKAKKIITEFKLSSFRRNHKDGTVSIFSSSRYFSPRVLPALKSRAQLPKTVNYAHYKAMRDPVSAAYYDGLGSKSHYWPADHFDLSTSGYEYGPSLTKHTEGHALLEAVLDRQCTVSSDCSATNEDSAVPTPVAECSITALPAPPAPVVESEVAVSDPTTPLPPVIELEEPMLILPVDVTNSLQLEDIMTSESRENLAQLMRSYESIMQDGRVSCSALSSDPPLVQQFEVVGHSGALSRASLLGESKMVEQPIDTTEEMTPDANFVQFDMNAHLGPTPGSKHGKYGHYQSLRHGPFKPKPLYLLKPLCPPEPMTLKSFVLKASTARSYAQSDAAPSVALPTLAQEAVSCVDEDDEDQESIWSSSPSTPMDGRSFFANSSDSLANTSDSRRTSIEEAVFSPISECFSLASSEDVPVQEEHSRKRHSRSKSMLKPSLKRAAALLYARPLNADLTSEADTTADLPPLEEVSRVQGIGKKFLHTFLRKGAGARFRFAQAPPSNSTSRVRGGAVITGPMPTDKRQARAFLFAQPPPSNYSRLRARRLGLSPTSCEK